MPDAVLRTRLATETDRDRLLDWRNDPETRAMSRSTAPVDPVTHARWLAAVLRDPDRVLVIGEDPGGWHLGMVRFDLARLEHGLVAEASLNLAPEARGRGIAAPLLRDAERWLRPPPDRLVARVRPDNPASLRAFERAGYRLALSRPDGEGMLTLVRTPTVKEG